MNEFAVQRWLPLLGHYSGDVVPLPKRELDFDQHPEPAPRPKLCFPSKPRSLPALQQRQEGVQSPSPKDCSAICGVLTKTQTPEGQVQG